MPFNLEILKTSSRLAYRLVFLGGVITSIGPCNVAMIPLIIGYLGGSVELSRRRSFTLSLTFAVGLAVTFMVLGVVASLVECRGCEGLLLPGGTAPRAERSRETGPGYRCAIWGIRRGSQSQ